MCLSCRIHGDCADCCRLPGDGCSSRVAVTFVVVCSLCGACGCANPLDDNNNNGCGLALLCDGDYDLGDDD